MSNCLHIKSFGDLTFIPFTLSQANFEFLLGTAESNFNDNISTGLDSLRLYVSVSFFSLDINTSSLVHASSEN